ncbi:hypothetical protein G9A89_022919 [Geosiphon pyriformis]|nr:hypothetical protein G9A89_022919 [Geosiphon pyriformis]
MEIPRNKNSSKDQQTSKSSNKQQKNRSNLFSTSNTSIPNIQSKKRKVTTTFNGVLLEIAKPSLKPKDPGVSAPQKLPPNATTNSFQLSVPNISSQTEIKDDLPPGPVENELLPFIPTEQKLTDNSVLPSRTPTSFKSYLQSRYRKLKDQKPREARIFS